MVFTRVENIISISSSNEENIPETKDKHMLVISAAWDIDIRVCFKFKVLHASNLAQSIPKFYSCNNFTCCLTDNAI